MKRWLLVFLASASLGAPVHADLNKGSQTVVIQFGGGGSNSKFEWIDGSFPLNDEEIADGGSAVGGQYMYYLRNEPTIGIGFDISHTELGDHESNWAFVNTKSHFRPTTYLVMTRLAYPKGPLRPYIFAGVGAHHTHLKLDLEPVQVFDSYGTGAAVAWGIGLDWFPAESFFVGLEYRGNYLASATYEPTVDGKSLGFDDAHGDLTYSNFFFRAGLKFGGV